MNVLTILKWFVAAIVEKCDAATARKIADSVLDKIENYFAQTKNKADDLLIEVIRRCIREPFGIPDNDDVETAAPDDDAETAAPDDDAETAAADDDAETAAADDAGGGAETE